MSKINNAVVFAVLATSSAVAQSQTAGTWMGKAGINHFYSSVKSGEITGVPGSRVDISDASNLIASGTYMITDHISTEIVIGTFPKHDILGAGTLAAAGKIGSLKFAPLAVAFQYRFRDPQSAFRPYIGGGILRALFRDVEGTPMLTALTNPGGPAATVSAENAWGYSIQGGFGYALNERWFIDATAIRMFVDTSAALSTGQRVDAKFRPLAVNASLGYRF